MAQTEEDKNQIKWPGPVTFDDDDPKKGYCTISLSMKELLVNKPLFGKAKPRNAEIEHTFEPGLVQLIVTVTPKPDTTVVYEYKKPLPEDITPENSSFKVKRGRMILSLCKADGQSWAQHAKYLIKKDS